MTFKADCFFLNLSFKNMHIRQACETEIEAWEQSPDSPQSQAASSCAWGGVVFCEKLVSNWFLFY